MFDSLELENLGRFDRLSWENFSRINVIVGENDTGKTYLLKLLYCIAKSVEEFTKRQQSDRPAWREVLAEKLFWVYQPEDSKLGSLVRKGENRLKVETRLSGESYDFTLGKDTTRQINESITSPATQPGVNALYIPPKEVLTGFEAIAAINEQLQIFGFDHTYYDLIKALRLPPTQGEIHGKLRKVRKSLDDLLDGKIQKEKKSFIFRRGQEKYWMSQTAEGIKKLGILTTLIRNRTLNSGTILFIDEPETNLHPSAIIDLVDMLFELSKADIPIFLATHSYFVLNRLEILARKERESI